MRAWLQYFKPLGTQADAKCRRTKPAGLAASWIAPQLPANGHKKLAVHMHMIDIGLWIILEQFDSNLTHLLQTAELGRLGMLALCQGFKLWLSNPRNSTVAYLVVRSDIPSSKLPRVNSKLVDSCCSLAHVLYSVPHKEYLSLCRSRLFASTAIAIIHVYATTVHSLSDHFR